MAEKSFGVKEINLIGASGTPTIESPNNLNLNAVNVAISTNATIGGNLTVSGTVGIAGTLTYEDVTNIDAIGIITARNGVNLTGGNLSLGDSGGSSDDRISIGAGGDINIYHNGTDSYVSNATGDLRLFSVGGSADDVLIRAQDDIELQPNNGQSGVKVIGTGAVELYHNNSKKLETSSSGAIVTGTLAATAVTGDGSGLTNLPAATPTTSDIQVVYEITNQTSFSYFRFAGNGVDSSANNPDIYLERGQKYRFINNSGGTSHPFEIQTTGGSAYNTGVTNNGASTGSASKNIDFAVRWDAPAQLKYQCTNHGSMQGNIYISGGDEGRSTTSAATGSIAQAAYADITIPTTGKTFALLKIAISAPAWVILYTDTSSRTSDAAGTGSGRSEGTDPTPGSGVLAEVSTTTSGASTFKMTPGLIGWNDDGTPAAQIYARVYNKRATSGSNAITVTLTSVIMEV